MALDAKREWWTTELIADALSVSEETVRRRYLQMAERGRIALQPRPRVWNLAEAQSIANYVQTCAQPCAQALRARLPAECAGAPVPK